MTPEEVSELLKSAPIRQIRQDFRGVCPQCGAKTDALSAMFHPGEGCPKRTTKKDEEKQP